MIKNITEKYPEYSEISERTNYPSSVGIITPMGNKNSSRINVSNKCSQCHINNSVADYSLCLNCLYNEIINETYSLYIDHIQNRKQKFKIPENIKIKDRSYKFSKLLNDYNKNIGDKICF